MNRSTPRSFLAGIALTFVAVGYSPAWATLPISQNPLIIPQAASPQVLFAVTNSQSMDGDLTGAIRTGDGVLPSAVSSLTNSSSGAKYAIPSGFTPPLNPGSAGLAPYTDTSTTAGTVSGLTAGVEYDNSPSRLNIAKAGIQSIIAAYASNVQFALENYNGNDGGSVYTTWVYLMSPSGGFTFAPDTSVPVSPNEYVLNPCYQYTSTSTSSTVASNCAAIVSAGLYSSATLGGNKYIVVAQSSDDSDVNDVLYAGSGLPGVFVDYGSLSKPTPYPPNFSLGNYESGGVSISYASVAPTSGIKETSPTNAGFVPFSTQVMYAERGFGYFSNANSTTGTVVVPMISAGNPATTASIAAVNNAFTAALAPETNSASSAEIKALSVQSPIAGLMATAKTYMTGLPSTTCATQKYVVLITDGLPTQDLSGNSWPPLGAASASPAPNGYGVSATFNSNGSLNTTNDQALTDTIANITALNTAGIKTYVIGLGAGVDTALNPTAAATLTSMAVAGGTTNFFPATSSSALVADLNTILASIQNASLNTGSLPVVGTRLTSNSLTYSSSFAVNGSDWIGDLIANSINSNGTAGVQAWDAGSLLNSTYGVGTAASGRNVITTTTAGTSAGNNTTANYFLGPNLGANTTAQLAFLGFTPTTAATYGTYGDPTDITNYLRGEQDHTTSSSTPGPFRPRSSIFGDIIDSAPAVSTNIDDFGYELLPGVQGTSYSTWLTNTKANRTPKTMVYVGANDGMLHGFNGGTTGGNELFAYVPNSIASNLDLLVSPNYTHQFYVDGPINVTDANLGTSSTPNWQTVLVGTPGAGGSGLFALNVSSPSSFAPANVLWELTGSSSPYMGYDLGQAQVILAQDGNWYAIVGNGYNSTNSQPALFVISMATGQIVNTIVATTDADPTPAAGNGISNIVALNEDVNPATNNGGVDTVYGGDYDGNVWKFDLSGTTPTNWKVGNGGNPLFVAKDSSGNRQPITGNFDVAAGPLGGVMVYFGTGSFFLVGDNVVPTNPQVQDLYGVWDNGTTGASLTRADLVQQTITSQTTSGGFTTRSTSSNTITYTATGDPRGFYMDLLVTGGTADGERFFGSPVVENGVVFFTTYEPLVGTCFPGGTRWLYGLGALTGANALNQILQSGGGSTICSNGNCGAISTGVGAPIPSASIVVPAPVGSPGLSGGTAVPGSIPCGFPGAPTSCTAAGSPNYSACTIVIRAQGSPPLVLPRPCGRQSWRQIR